MQNLHGKVTKKKLDKCSACDMKAVANNDLNRK